MTLKFTSRPLFTRGEGEVLAPPPAPSPLCREGEKPAPHLPLPKSLPVNGEGLKKPLCKWRGITACAVIGLVVLAAVWMVAAPVAAQQGGGTAGPGLGTIQVGIVVQGADELPQTFCVTLDGENPTGLDALKATGLDIATSSGPQGTLVCRMDQVGCTPPGENCFCQCMGGSTCAYWAYFHLGDQGSWQYSVTGADNSPVTQGGVEGWWWRVGGSSAALPVIPFGTICTPSFPRTVIDGLGREVVIESPPRRIASVTLGSDEILLDLVGAGRLLGVSYFAKDPAVSNITDRLDGIANTDLSGNPERLISLDADLVVMAKYNDPAALAQLLDAHVPVFVLADFNTIDDIRANIRLLGQATGTEARAEAMIQRMDRRLAAVQAKVKDQKSVRVLYYEPGGVTYGPGSTVDEIIRLAGGINVIGEADLGPYPLISAEYVLTADPDLILLGAWFSEDDPLAWFTTDPAFSGLRAVKDGRVYAISDAHMTNVSQYVVLGVEDVAHALYPGAFGE
jgi:iron complex transport system substrate-binding protein